MDRDSDLEHMRHWLGDCMVGGMNARRTEPSRSLPGPLSDDEREDLAGAVSDWPTTRRFARSAHATDAAFPNDAAYADPFERFTRASFVDQDAQVQVQALSQKWAQRCIYAIAIGVVVALLGGWL